MTVRARAHDLLERASHGAADTLPIGGAYAPPRFADLKPAVAWRLGREAQDRLAVFMRPMAIAESSQQLLEIVGAGDFDLVIADPAMDDGRCADAMSRVCTEFPSVLVVSYTVLTAAVLPSILRLSACGVDDFVLFRHDDTEMRFAELAERSMANPLVEELLRALDDQLQLLPPSLAGAIARLFASPRRFRTADDLAAASQMTRRSLYRHLAIAGFRSPRLLLSSARVLRAIGLLADGGKSVRDISRGLGYSKAEQLSEQLRGLAGLSVREIRSRTSVAGVARSVARALTT